MLSGKRRHGLVDFDIGFHRPIRRIPLGLKYSLCRRVVPRRIQILYTYQPFSLIVAGISNCPLPRPGIQSATDRSGRGNRPQYLQDAIDIMNKPVYTGSIQSLKKLNSPSAHLFFLISSGFCNLYRGSGWTCLKTTNTYLDTTAGFTESVLVTINKR